jgi:hypothetical protein
MRLKHQADESCPIATDIDRYRGLEHCPWYPPAGRRSLPRGACATPRNAEAAGGPRTGALGGGQAHFPEIRLSPTTPCLSGQVPVFLCTEEARLDSSVRFGAALDETHEKFWRLPPTTKATESMLDEPGSQEWKSRIMRDSVDA